MDETRIQTTAELLAGFASGSDDPLRRAAEMIDVLADDPRWTPKDLQAIRICVEERLVSGQAAGGVLLLS